VMVARDEGLRTLKLFPAAQLGAAAMISALRGPFGDVEFVPSGGIGIGNAASFAIDGVASVSTSWIAPRSEISADGFDAVTERARRFRHEVAR